MSEQQSHIVITGGGMVGLSLALLLAQCHRGWRITVLEAFAAPPGATPPRYRPSFDARASALSQYSRLVFEHLGLWRELAAHVAPIATIDVSDRGHVGGTSLTAAEQSVPALGYVIENTWLGAVLGAAVARHERIELLAPAAPAAIRLRRSGVELAVEESGETLHAELLVVGDGAASRTRDQLGIEVTRRDYGQTALIANVALREPHHGVAYERFTQSGPMALLPLPDMERSHRAALVWTLPPSVAAHLAAVPEAQFLETLHQRFGYRAGRLVRVGERHTYPLQLVVAQEQCRRHVVVVGNAAHSLHPVAGQGFNLALRDVDRLARVLGRGCVSPGELSLLQDYVEQSRADQAQTMLLSEGLPRLFGREWSPLALARNLGLLGLDAVPPLRRAFARRGMGFNS